MKKISSPDKNLHVPKEEPIKYSEITIEDVREWKRQLEESGIISRRTAEINVVDLGNGYYQLSGGVHGRVPKKQWDEAIFAAAGITK